MELGHNRLFCYPLENRSLIPVTLLYDIDIMSTTTALDFQAVITQNERNKKLLENTSIIL